MGSSPVAVTIYTVFTVLYFPLMINPPLVSQRLSVRVRLLAVCASQLSLAIVRLMSMCYQEYYRAWLDVAQCFFLQFFVSVGALERNAY